MCIRDSYRPAERPLSQEQWDALDAPISNCHIYNLSLIHI